jgi:AbrB family looped-hinge helix DNA binding protein
MAKVTSKLQVTVPKAVADRLGIKPGDDIDWQMEGHTARVVPSMSVPRLTLEQRLAIFDASTSPPQRGMASEAWRQGTRQSRLDARGALARGRAR